MTVARTGDLIEAAIVRGGAVPAFNVISLDQAEAIVAGATDAATPVLLQVSENAIRYRGAPEPLLAACRELAAAAEVPVGIHLDHMEDDMLVARVLERAADLGVGSIMIDASRLDYAENVAATRRVADLAHGSGLWIEAELGAIGGKDGVHAPGVRTDPDEARAFVDQTGVDALAVAVGSSHAMLERSASLDLPLIARLAAVVPVPLVLHGSSGVTDGVLASAVAGGIRKVNIGTALNVVGTAVLRDALAEHPDAVDPRTYGRAGRAATAALVAHLCHAIASPVV